MSRHKMLMAILLGVLPAACHRSDEKPAPSAAATAQAQGAPATERGDPAKTPPPPPAAPAAPALPTKAESQPREVDAAGLTLRLHDNGHVTLLGKDRWGGAIDTTYENRDFLLKALPVLERSIGPEQVAALRRALATPTEKPRGAK